MSQDRQFYPGKAEGYLKRAEATWHVYRLGKILNYDVRILVRVRLPQDRRFYPGILKST